MPAGPLQDIPMHRIAMSLRYTMLIAAIGAAIGAILMFWEGGARILAGVQAIVAGPADKTVVASVMGGTDALLLGIVLVIFAYAITFGFVFDLSPEERDRLPPWMRAQGVNELKETLVSVILVYLIVDFATDWPAGETALVWQALVKPISILLIAAAFWLFAASHPRIAPPAARPPKK